MKFHDYETLHHWSRSRGYDGGRSIDEWTTEEVARLKTMPDVQRDQAGWTVAHRMTAELRWTQAKRPYYSVYPFVADSLVRLPLDLDCSLIRLPLPDLMVRFAAGHELDVLGNDQRLLRSLLASRVTTTRGEGLAILVDFGEQSEFPIQSYISFGLPAGKSVETAIHEMDYRELRENAAESDAALVVCVRLICTLCLLGDDPSLVTPDVLDRDRLKYDKTHDPAIIDRARRRGKFGWLIGATLECDPHYRRPHLALRWTGHGRTVPRIVPIKGAIVHRSKLTDLPQGRLDNEPQKMGSAARKIALEAATLQNDLEIKLEDQ